MVINIIIEFRYWMKLLLRENKSKIVDVKRKLNFWLLQLCLYFLQILSPDTNFRTNLTYLFFSTILQFEPILMLLTQPSNRFLKRIITQFLNHWTILISLHLYYLKILCKPKHISQLFFKNIPFYFIHNLQLRVKTLNFNLFCSVRSSKRIVPMLVFGYW